MHIVICKFIHYIKELLVELKYISFVKIVFQYKIYILFFYRGKTKGLYIKLKEGTLRQFVCNNSRQSILQFKIL